MPLPPEVARRVVVGSGIFSDGELVNGQITFTPMIGEAVETTTKTSIYMRPVPVGVTAGEFTVPLIPWDDPSVDAGLYSLIGVQQPWAYKVERTWTSDVVWITVRQGPLGTVVDPPLDISDLITPNAPDQVAMVQGIPGVKGDAGSVTSVAGVPPDGPGNVPLTPADIGAASLVGGVIPTSQIPAIALTNVMVVASQAAMLALTTTQVQPGDVAARTDGAGTFMLTNPAPSVLANWVLLNSPTDKVVSVNGQTGTVVLSAADLGLSDALPSVEPSTFSVTGPVAVATGKSRIYLEGAYTFVSARAAVNTAPTGSPLIVDIMKNGSTIYTTQANRPTIPAAGFTATGNSPAVTTFAAGDYLTVNVSQVGSTVAGSDLTVTIRLLRTS